MTAQANARVDRRIATEFDGRKLLVDPSPCGGREEIRHAARIPRRALRTGAPTGEKNGEISAVRNAITIHIAWTRWLIRNPDCVIATTRDLSPSAYTRGWSRIRPHFVPLPPMSNGAIREQDHRDIAPIA
jgi:hypothetical protein